MNLTELSTRHWPSVAVVVALTGLFGIMSMSRLPIQLLPTIEEPEINVANFWRAVADAVRLHARPIYMSTLTSVFGMLPLMVIPGVGSQIYRGLATVIIGGMTMSAIFTLILLPSVLRLSPLNLSRFRRINTHRAARYTGIEANRAICLPNQR